MAYFHDDQLHDAAGAGGGGGGGGAAYQRPDLPLPLPPPAAAYRVSDGAAAAGVLPYGDPPGAAEYGGWRRSSGGAGALPPTYMRGSSLNGSDWWDSAIVAEVLGADCDGEETESPRFGVDPAAGTAATDASQDEDDPAWEPLFGRTAPPALVLRGPGAAAVAAAAGGDQNPWFGTARGRAASYPPALYPVYDERLSGYGVAAVPPTHGPLPAWPGRPDLRASRPLSSPLPLMSLPGGWYERHPGRDPYDPQPGDMPSSWPPPALPQHPAARPAAPTPPPPDLQNLYLTPRERAVRALQGVSAPSPPPPTAGEAAAAPSGDQVAAPPPPPPGSRLLTLPTAWSGQVTGPDLGLDLNPPGWWRAYDSTDGANATAAPGPAAGGGTDRGGILAASRHRLRAVSTSSSAMVSGPPAWAQLAGSVTGGGGAAGAVPAAAPQRQPPQPSRDDDSGWDGPPDGMDRHASDSNSSGGGAVAAGAGAGAGPTGGLAAVWGQAAAAVVMQEVAAAGGMSMPGGAGGSSAAAADLSQRPLLSSIRAAVPLGQRQHSAAHNAALEAQRPPRQHAAGPASLAPPPSHPRLRALASLQSATTAASGDASPAAAGAAEAEAMRHGARRPSVPLPPLPPDLAAFLEAPPQQEQQQAGLPLEASPSSQQQQQQHLKRRQGQEPDMPPPRGAKRPSTEKQPLPPAAAAAAAPAEAAAEHGAIIVEAQAQAQGPETMMATGRRGSLASGLWRRPREQSYEHEHEHEYRLPPSRHGELSPNTPPFALARHAGGSGGGGPLAPPPAPARRTQAPPAVYGAAHPPYGMPMPGTAGAVPAGSPFAGYEHWCGSTPTRYHEGGALSPAAAAAAGAAGGGGGLLMANASTAGAASLEAAADAYLAAQQMSYAASVASGGGEGYGEEALSGAAGAASSFSIPRGPRASYLSGWDGAGMPDAGAFPLSPRHQPFRIGFGGGWPAAFQPGFPPMEPAPPPEAPAPHPGQQRQQQQQLHGLRQGAEGSGPVAGWEAAAAVDVNMEDVGVGEGEGVGVAAKRRRAGEHR
ncbi:hypothetical protein GPECTOR_110g237 [Gonium pectorale]|uniref:Uncharacterized protein n=1 Tax=Gonium pectorale TaxID=33097 RepID=A0A150FZB8_GONPE|nr:hypothetical protein GPECTOR_110g237 [Gonium pectorale]|eukprot:KXZ42944.1 hypothetical protein GPECTOR_110g237 [Gonium pectorale]